MRAAVLIALLLASGAAHAQDVAASRAEGFRVAGGTEAAFGVAPGRFHNQLVGVRVDYAFSPHVSLGLGVAYVNMKGKDGRAHDVLPSAQLEYLWIPRAAGGSLLVPVRFAMGYLPRNGPTLRAATGLGVALSPDTELLGEILAPMVWISHEQAVLSLDLAVELRTRF